MNEINIILQKLKEAYNVAYTKEPVDTPENLKFIDNLKAYYNFALAQSYKELQEKKEGSMIDEFREWKNKREISDSDLRNYLSETYDTGQTYTIKIFKDLLLLEERVQKLEEENDAD